MLPGLCCQGRAPHPSHTLGFVCEGTSGTAGLADRLGDLDPYFLTPVKWVSTHGEGLLWG